MSSTDTDRLERLETVLYGNGKLGVHARVMILWYSWFCLFGGVGTVLGWMLRGLIEP